MLRFMRCLGLLVSLAVPARAGAVSNAVVVSPLSGGAQVNYPLTISRVFVQGEIPHYAQARVNGSPVLTQCDVKTRWPDGSLQHAIVSFHAGLAASGSRIDFVDQASGNNAGAMDRAAMLAANWGAQIEITNGTTLSANARRILTDWQGGSSDKRVTYWLRGPVCTQVILEDRSPALAYDLGWDQHRSLHPMFVATFYPGYRDGVKVDVILENAWTTKLQDQRYSVQLRTGEPLGQPVYTRSGVTHLAASRWRKTFWSGTAPAQLKIDHNLPYLIAAKVLPNYDLSKRIPAETIEQDLAAFNRSDKGEIGGSGTWTADMSTTGGRPDIGVVPAWYVRYLYTMDPSMGAMTMALAGVSGHVNIHFRESDATRYYDSGRSIKAFGYPLSIDARPGVYIPELDHEVNEPADKLVPVGSKTNGVWHADLAHEPAMTFVPYVLTGDWYWLEELYFLAAADLASAAPMNGYYGRHGAWGYFPFAIQTRAQAWGLSHLAEAAFAAPDGSPEKAYFTEKLLNNIAVEEGQQGVQDGAFPPRDASCPGYNEQATTDRWCWGRKTIGLGASNPLHFANQGQTGDGDERFVAPSDPYAVSQADAPWMYGYKFHALGHVQELGFPIAGLNRVLFKWLLHALRDPEYNPWLTGAYLLPVMRKSTGTYYQSWAELLRAYSTAWSESGSPRINLRTVAAWPEGNSEDDVEAPGYPHIMKGAASYLPGINDGALLGQRAWEWIAAHVKSPALMPSPQFSLVPRTTAPKTATCDLTGDGAIDRVDVDDAIAQAIRTAGCTSADLDGDGECNVVDVQRLINAALGGACRIGS